MIFWDRLLYIYAELTDNATITNKQRRYVVFQSMMSWITVLMGSRPLREICDCVLREVRELFPNKDGNSDEECDSSGVIDLLD